MNEHIPCLKVWNIAGYLNQLIDLSRNAFFIVRRRPFTTECTENTEKKQLLVIKNLKFTIQNCPISLLAAWREIMFLFLNRIGIGQSLSDSLAKTLRHEVFFSA